MADTITLKAECHCGYASYTYPIPKSAFPLKSSICHCESCRHVSGQIFTTHAVIPFDERPDVSKLKSYASSKGLTRYFCPNCGATMINFERDEWEFATGVLSVEGKPEVGALNTLLDRVQLWVSDTFDGGGSIWLSGEWEGKRHMYNRGSEAATDQMLRYMVSNAEKYTSNNADDVLKARCHCGTIKLTVARPDKGTKYPAGIDACMSCRKVVGFEITGWATLDLAKISINENGLDLISDLSHYKSSEKVHRYFCGTCGAPVFYLKEGRTTIDLMVGLLDSPRGARAEGWLDWTKYDDFVAFREDAIDEQYVQTLIDGVKESQQQISST